MIRIADLKADIHREQDVIVLDRGVRAYGKLNCWTPTHLIVKLNHLSPCGSSIGLKCDPKHATFAAAVRHQ